MSLPKKLRKSLTLTLALALAGLLAAPDADAGASKKTKKKKSKSSQTSTSTQGSSAQAAGLSTPPPAVLTANRHLLAYETEPARLALEGAPEADAWVATARGRILTQQSDYEAAATELRRAADLDPKNPAPALFLGESLAYAEKPGEAGEAYAQAETRALALLAVAAEDPDALYYLGVAQQRLKRFEESATTLEKVRALRPEDALIPYRLGTTRFYQQRWQQAFDNLSAALERNSGIVLAYYYRGLAASKLGRKDVLYNDLDRFVKMAPNAPEAANARQILSAFR